MPVASYKLKFYLCVVRQRGTLFPPSISFQGVQSGEITSRSELTSQCIKRLPPDEWLAGHLAAATLRRSSPQTTFSGTNFLIPKCFLSPLFSPASLLLLLPRLLYLITPLASFPASFAGCYSSPSTVLLPSPSLPRSLSFSECLVLLLCRPLPLCV